MEYDFEWDHNKAKLNTSKHGISFELATEVFLDPAALSTFDEDHSEKEDRWVTLGRTKDGLYLVVVHTFNEYDEDTVTIRMISARKATGREIRQYEGK